MKPRKTDKNQLLENTSELIRINGYHNTSISDIANACNLSKGSVYHYITSKQSLVLEVIENTHRYFKSQIFSIAEDEGKSAAERIKALNAALEGHFTDRKGGSLMANLVLEVVDTVPEFVGLFKTYFSDWKNALVKLLSTKLDAEQADTIATDAICQIQGAVLHNRLFNDLEPLKRVSRQLEQHLA